MSTGAVRPPSSFLERLTAAPGARLAMATLVSATGSTPKKAGAKMLLDVTGAISGTVTIGGCVDARVLSAAAQCLAGAPATLLDISLGEEEAWELGLTCGGSVSVFIELVDDAVRTMYAAAHTELAAGRAVVIATRLMAEPGRTLIREADLIGRGSDDGRREFATARVFPEAVSRRASASEIGEEGDVFFEYLAPPKQVVIIGAGEIARSLVPIAHELEMVTIVIDSRERFATHDRFPDADAVHVGIPSEIVSALPLSSRTAIVLVAHDYKYELPILRHVLRTSVGYIGMLGGKRRGATIRQMLSDEGFTSAELARIHSPIGLDIGARSTAEIALSIVAELVALDRPAS